MKDFFEILYLTPRMEEGRLILPYRDTSIELTYKEHPSVQKIIDLVKDYESKGDDRISVDLKINGKHDDTTVEITSIEMEFSSYWGGDDFEDDDFLYALPINTKLLKSEGFGKMINYHLEE